MKYQQLNAGDVRQKGDETRRKGPYTKEHYSSKFMIRYEKEFNFQPVTLVGHPILTSDLMVMEFRRPI